MKNLKNKNNKMGRPCYIEDITLLKQLFKKVNNGELTNEKAWKLAKCGKTKWYQLKKKYNIGGNDE